MRVRCITLNLKGLDYGWFEGRSTALVEGLRTYRPDVLCFQESTVRQSTPLYNQARAIGEALGLETCLFSPYGNPAEMVSRDQGGIAVVSRFTVLDARGRRLPPGHRGPSDARAALFVQLRGPEGTFGVTTTHLSWRPEESEVRLLQMGILLNEMARDPWFAAGKSHLVAGDLNAAPDEPAIQVIRERMTDAYRAEHPHEAGYTWSSANDFTHGLNLEDRRIDYIFVDPTAKVVGCDVILDKPKASSGRFLSDHFGVFAEIEWS